MKIGTVLYSAAIVATVTAEYVVKPGIQKLFEDHKDLLKGKSVGVISNPTGVLPNLTNNVDFITEAHPEVNLTAIFAPEQGFRGAEQAGASSGGYSDPKTGITVHSLYGNSSDEILTILNDAGVDTILFDLQDVGARFYTYAWTMADTMEAIAGTDKRLIVLDRPNPIGGERCEGPVLQSNYSSFVGRYPISMQHGMTIGELATLFNDKFVPKQTQGKKANVEVIWMEGWKRNMFFDDTGLPYVMPSINLPTLTSVMVYPGMGLFEGLTLSEGRGTTHPFEIVGAPFVDYKLSDALVVDAAPGAQFIQSNFVPTFEDFANETCIGVQLYVQEKHEFSPIRTALDVITKSRDMYPDGFGFGKTFDRLAGNGKVRQDLLDGKQTHEIMAGWQHELHDFKKLRQAYLHYD